MRALPLAATLLAGLLCSSAWAAESPSPIGNWKTIDDNTGKPRGLVQIYEEAGEIKGKILKNYPKPGEPDNPVCDKCKGDRKDKPVIGMVFLWGMKKNGESWAGGEILDPDNGSVYSAKMEVIEGGSKLKVRGFLGFSLLGRSQIWLRDTEAK
ncbi:DUF2147 domain-containing protein [Parachitinimonas caeni]|uniref:DUF2147 domain-containing protein n=1 Tax=Parachitinimonas caeni TaxID=3031301 RepID=A0ABT7DYW6_9NEIS|nr:DUF2147 domain-containing protein [Parachitinimonas caeni]MDK2125204.1 DUF2147 domain-containing protein [Parachitinimonas caeni]